MLIGAKSPEAASPIHLKDLGGMQGGDFASGKKPASEDNLHRNLDLQQEMSVEGGGSPGRNLISEGQLRSKCPPGNKHCLLQVQHFIYDMATHVHLIDVSIKKTNFVPTNEKLIQH